MKRVHFLQIAASFIPASAFARTDLLQTLEKPFVVRSGKSRFGGEPMKYQGVHPNDVVLSKKDTDNMLSMFFFSGSAKVGPPLHMHFEQDEFFYVVQGEYRFVAGNETMNLSAGDTIFLPRNIPHTWLQLTEKGKLFYGVQPAGSMEEFFKELDSFKKPPTEEELQKIHLKHRIQLIGPPLQL